MSMKLDLACGERVEPGFRGVDIAELPGVDIVLDLQQYPWPLPDASYDELRCSHFVEHVHDLCAFMNECHRILVTDGLMTITHPYYTSIRATQDPTHVRFMSENSWLYFDAKWRDEQKLSHYPIVADFEVVEIRASYLEPWKSANDEKRMHATRHYWNVIEDLIVTLRKRG